MAPISFCAPGLPGCMELDRRIPSVLCLGQGISLAWRYCVPPHALEGAGAGDQSVIPWPSSLFQARGRGVGALIGLLPMTCCLPLGGLGGGDLG